MRGFLTQITSSLIPRVGPILQWKNLVTQVLFLYIYGFGRSSIYIPTNYHSLFNSYFIDCKSFCIVYECVVLKYTRFGVHLQIKRKSEFGLNLDWEAKWVGDMEGQLCRQIMVIKPCHWRWCAKVALINWHGYSRLQ